MRRLCFGGSFNPIHNGHLICARAIAETEGFDRVILIPSAHPPHKPCATDLAPSENRLDMCRLAADQQPDLFEVNDLELRRTGPSFTIDTVRQLRQSGWSEINWLIGADMLRLLPSWHEPEALLREATFIVMARPGWQFDWSSLPAPYRDLEKAVRPAPLIDISATDIRRRLSAGLSIDFLTPRPVIEYIAKHRLYQ
jgi:nicotinate-nucleotide adenylyltransferase